MRFTTLVFAHDESVEPSSLMPVFSADRVTLVHNETTDDAPTFTKTDAGKMKKRSEGEDV